MTKLLTNLAQASERVTPVRDFRPYISRYSGYLKCIGIGFTCRYVCESTRVWGWGIDGRED